MRRDPAPVDIDHIPWIYDSLPMVLWAFHQYDSEKEFFVLLMEEIPFPTTVWMYKTL